MKICKYFPCTNELPAKSRTFCSAEHQVAHRNATKRRINAETLPEKICDYSPCNNILPPTRKRFCCGEHLLAAKEDAKVIYKNDNFLGDERAKYIAKKKKREQRICTYQSCNAQLPSKRKKFCSDEHFELARKAELVNSDYAMKTCPICKELFKPRFDRNVFCKKTACKDAGEKAKNSRNRPKAEMKKKQLREERRITRICEYENCTEILGVLRKRFCTKEHYTLFHEQVKLANNPERPCPVCKTLFIPKTVRNKYCTNPICKQTILDEQREVLRQERKTPSNYGSITRPYSPIPSHVYRQKRNGDVSVEYSAIVEIKEITHTDLTLSSEASAIQAFLDSGKKIQKVVFEHSAKSLEFEDMEEYEDPTDLSRFGNYSSSWNLTKLHD